MYLSTVLIIGTPHPDALERADRNQESHLLSHRAPSVPERLAIAEPLTDLIEHGDLKSEADRCYLLDQTAEAHAYVDTGHKSGNVTITPWRGHANPHICVAPTPV